jgi:hypothetical protein
MIIIKDCEKKGYISTWRLAVRCLVLTVAFAVALPPASSKEQNEQNSDIKTDGVLFIGAKIVLFIS